MWGGRALHQEHDALVEYVHTEYMHLHIYRGDISAR